MRWKWILGIAVFLAVALIATGTVILSRYDYNNLKPAIARAIKGATGRELTLWGNIDLEAGLTPPLLVRDIAFHNAPWDSRSGLAKIRRFMRVALFPLIRRYIEVKRLILGEPDIVAETDISGRSNLGFKTPKKAVPAKEEPTEEKPNCWRWPSARSGSRRDASPIKTDIRAGPMQ